MNTPLHQVLLVDDNADDRFLITRAIRRSGLPVSLATVDNGDEATAYLAGTGPYADRERYPLPELVLLDWKLPRRSGREVLAWIRAQPQVRTLPVVVLTTSREDVDVRDAYAAGANSYLSKPGVSADLAELVRATLSYWLQLNLPAGPPPHAGPDTLPFHEP